MYQIFPVENKKGHYDFRFLDGSSFFNKAVLAMWHHVQDFVREIHGENLVNWKRITPFSDPKKWQKKNPLKAPTPWHHLTFLSLFSGKYMNTWIVRVFAWCYLQSFGDEMFSGFSPVFASFLGLNFGMFANEKRPLSHAGFPGSSCEPLSSVGVSGRTKPRCLVGWDWRDDNHLGNL